MEEEIIGLMSSETEKELGKKLKFKNSILEIVDDPLVKIIDNKVLHPLAQKLPPDILPVVIAALAEVVSEMPEIEI